MDIYESMISALREHWKAHNNAYPQRFELMQSTCDEVAKQRALVVETMNYKTKLLDDFLGVPIVVSAEGNAMVDADGSRLPLAG